MVSSCPMTLAVPQQSKCTASDGSAAARAVANAKAAAADAVAVVVATAVERLYLVHDAEGFA